jgi:hypothetical protein
MKKFRVFLCVSLMILVLVFGASHTLAQHLTETYDNQVALDWMTLLYELVRDEKANAPAAARLYGYAGVALYEAVVPGMPENFSVGGQLEDLPMLPWPEEDLEYDWPAVANGSLSTVIHGLFPEGTDETHERIDALREQYITERTEATSEEIAERSLALGDEIGAMLVEWIASDNYGPTRKMEYEIPAGEPHLWIPTTEGTSPMEPFWGQLRPFGLDYAERCNVPMRMDFSTDPDSTFYKQAAEVMNAGDNLTDFQQETARFWLDTPGITGAPSGHWVMIGIQYAEQYELPLNRVAEMFMLLNTALSDAFISAWALKYEDNLIRPVSYIQQHIRRNWQPYVETPPFPEYPSGHSVVSGAAAEVLTVMFGQNAFVDRTPILNGHEQLEREFTSFEAAATQAAISRLYGGIHYRAAIENGLRQGRCVGQQILVNIRLRSVPQGE